MAATCSKIIIIFVNLIFFLIGLAFLVGGVFIKVGEKYYQPQLDKFQDKIPDISSSGGFQDADTTDDSAPSLDLGSMLSTLAIILIVFGIFMLLTSIMGMCGACCAKKCMLAIYISIVGVLFTAKLAVLIVLLTNAFEGTMKKEIKKIIKKKYGGIDDFGIESLSMNFIMMKYECCGVDNYQDFDDAQNWDNERLIEVNGVNVTVTLETPLACCKTSGNFPSVDIDNLNCTFAPTDDISNWNTGCWDTIEDEVTANKYMFAGVFGGILGFELICIICSCCIIKSIKEDNQVKGYGGKC